MLLLLLVVLVLVGIIDELTEVTDIPALQALEALQDTHVQNPCGRCLGKFLHPAIVGESAIPIAIKMEMEMTGLRKKG